MADELRLALEVALVRDGHTISGTVQDHAGSVVEFAGWLQFMSAFDTICARAQSERSDDGSRGSTIRP